MQVFRSKCFSDKPWIYYSNINGAIGNGLVSSNGELWERHRTLIQPTFHLKILEGFVEPFAEEAKNFVDRLRMQVGRDADFGQEMHLTMSLCAVRTILSGNIREEDKSTLEVSCAERSP